MNLLKNAITLITPFRFTIPAIINFSNAIYFRSLLLTVLFFGLNNCITAQTIYTPGSFTFTVPAGITTVTIECWGAGGGGGGSTSNNSGGSGGGAGGYTKRVYNVTPGQSISYTVGAGGAGGAANGGAGGVGSTGGSSYVTSTELGFISITAFGGLGGSPNKGPVGVGGDATNGGDNQTGGNGSAGGTSSGSGGDCPNGGAGGVSITNGNGREGTSPGGGGSGGEKGTTNSIGGKGGDGQIRFSWAPTVVIGYKSNIIGDDQFVIDGANRPYTKAKLLNPVNFGPTGTSPFSFTFYDFGSSPITEAALLANGVQILDLGIQNNPDGGSGSSITSYTSAEINAIKAWTISSNKRVVLAFQGFANALGGSGYEANGYGNDNPNVITSTGQQILSGPFGITSSFNQAGTYQGIFSKYPQSTSCVLVQDQTPDPTGLVDNITGDIYLADVGLVSQVEQVGELTSSSSITSNTDRFLANLYHGMARIVQYGPITVCDFFSCAAGINPPTFNASSINIKCPATTANLNSIFTGTLPSGISLLWYTNSTHSGSPYPTPTAAEAGTYYAFFVDPENNCFSPVSLPIVVEPGILINSTNLTGFSYIVGNGPSAQQTLYVTGSCLSVGITITPPVNYEIWNGASFQSSAIVLPQTGGNVPTTAVTLRLKSGLPVGDYPATLVLASTGAASKYVALSGSVTNSYCSSTGDMSYKTSVTLVRFNTINNVSAKPSGYTDYSSTLQTNVIAGSPYYLTVNLNTDGAVYIYCAVFIDWNRDGDFNDPGESYDLGYVYSSSNGQTSLSPLQITVPLTASVGFTKMRVSCRYNNYPSACLSNFDGEVEDYGVNILKNFWRGNTSTDWGTPSNWTAGFIPESGDDVIYSTGNPYSVAVRDLVVDGDRTVNNLINATTKRLEIPVAKSLTVSKTITTDGNSDRIYIKSENDKVNGSLVFNNPKTSPVAATVEMYSKAQAYSPGIVVNGVTYRYTWQFFGIPMRSVVANPTFAGSYVRIYDEAKTVTNGKWTQLTNSSVLSSFKGYEITQALPKTIYFTGILENKDTTITLVTTSGAYDPGQHILSNPYTAAIDIRKLTFGSNTDNAIYLYNTGSFGQWSVNGGATGNSNSTPGQYLSIPKNTAGGATGIPYDIPSMQGFLVKTLNSATGSITIPYSSVTTGNVSLQKPQRSRSSSGSSDKTYIKFSVESNSSLDNMWLFKVDSTSHGYDNGWDGEKQLNGYGAAQVFAMEDSVNYQISAVDDVNNTYVGFRAGADVEYTIVNENQNIENTYQAVYLVDLVENKTIDITQSGASYTFTADTLSAVKRFKIVADLIKIDVPEIIIPEIIVDNDKGLYVYSADKTIFVNNKSDQSGKMFIYDVAGRMVRQESFEPNSISTFKILYSPGVYLVSAFTDTNRVENRVILK